jgi:A/G-specific adenine glycosylase
MLQQTRVETVIPYYHRFLNLFPTVTALAAARTTTVMKAWEGLGYYRRARLFQQGARVVLTQFGGRLPADPTQLQTIPGIGPYMAGALSSIAFKVPVPAVDGNVKRVFARITAWDQPIENAAAKRAATAWVALHLPREAASDFTQALMELGAVVCLPGLPRCAACPVRAACLAAPHEPARFPIRRPTRTIPCERRIILCIIWSGRRLLIRRPAKGLMAGFWEYPNLFAQPNDDPFALARDWTCRELGAALEFGFSRFLTHAYTHLRWDLELFDAVWDQNDPPLTPPGGAWLDSQSEDALPRVAFVRSLAPR